MFKQLQKMYEKHRDKQDICRRLEMDPKTFDFEEFMKSGDQTRWTHPVSKGLNDFLDCPREIVYKRGLDVTKLSLFVNEKIVSNYSKISESDRKKLNAKYFIMILNPYDELIKHPAEKIATLSDYSNYIKNRFAVRAFPIETGEVHVLVKEVSEIVRLALQRKPNVTKEDFERARTFLRDYEDKNVYRTVSFGFFIAIMEKLEIDQSLITLVPCVVWVYTSMAALQEPIAPVGIFNSDGEMIITGPQAMLYTFQSIVCGINWNLVDCGEKCEIEKKCPVSQFRGEVFAVLKSYWELPENAMITKKLVDERISILRTVLARCQLTQVPDCFYRNLAYSDKISFATFREKWRELGYSNMSSINPRDSFSVQEVRMLCTFGAIREFFPFQLEDMAMKIVHELGCMIPKELRDVAIVELKNTIGAKFKATKQLFQKASEIEGKVPKPSESSETPSETESNHDNSSETSPNTSESMKTSVTSSENELERVELPEKSANEQSAPEALETSSETFVHSESKPTGLQKPQAIVKPQLKSLKAPQSVGNKKASGKSTSSENKDSSKESQLCQKCTRNGQSLLKAQEKLKIAEKKAEKFESQSNKYDELEKKMRKMKKEMEELKKENEMVKKESEGLKEELKRKTEEVENLEKKNKDLENEVLSEQQKNINHLQEKAVMNQKIEGIQLKFALEKSQLEHALSRKQMSLQQLNSMGSRPSSSRASSNSDSSPRSSSATFSGTSSGTSSKHPSTSGPSSEPSTSSRTVPQTGFDPKLDCYICLDKFQEGQKVVVCKGCNNPLHEMCGSKWSKAQKELNVKDEACGFCRRRMEVENQKNKKK